MCTLLKSSWPVLSLLLMPYWVFAAPLGPGFTYQGQINAGALPINGVAHLRFSLWDDAGTGAPPVGGNQLGVSQLIADVPVANGVFVVLLNAGGEFGATAFNGEARWLQIEVCGDAGCGSLQVLSPRQPLTGAPYSLGPWNTAPNGDIVYSGPGNVGIGTVTPGKKLTVAGNMEIGTSSGDYVHLRIGGGNSSGFLYGSFPHFADGIHLGYNYYADNAGTNQIIHPDGGTSRITAGYGFVTIATQAAFSGEPVNRLIVENNGNVRLGADTLLYAPGGEENLRIIRGIIAADGSIVTGSGFSVSHPSIGQYTITFNSSFTGLPTFTGTPDHDGDIRDRIHVVGLSNNSVSLYITLADGSNSFADTRFNFIVVGPR